LTVTVTRSHQGALDVSVSPDGAGLEGVVAGLMVVGWAEAEARANAAIARNTVHSIRTRSSSTMLPPINDGKTVVTCRA